MIYQYQPSFVRDTKKLTPSINSKLLQAIDNIKTAATLNDVPNVKKLKGHSVAYRIKVDTYRLCFFYKEDNTLLLSRFLPRKDVYRFFP